MLGRYVALSLCRSYLLVAAVIWAVFGIFEFVQMADAVDGVRFGVVDALVITALAMPATLVDFAPFIALLGTLHGLAGFARSHELVAMVFGGFSPLRLILTTVMATLSLLGFSGLVELAARPMAQQAELMYMSKTSADGSLFAESGIWVQTARSSYLHVESLAEGGAPTNIKIIEWRDDRHLARFLQAERAVVGADGAWQLNNALERRFSGNDSTGASVVHRAAYLWRPPEVESVAIYQLPVASLSIRQLATQVEQLRALEQAQGAFSVELWRRLILPLAALVYCVLAIPVVFRIPLRVGGGVVMLVGGVGAGAIYFAQQFAALGVYAATDSALAAALLPVGAVSVAALALNRYQFTGRPGARADQTRRSG